MWNHERNSMAGSGGHNAPSTAAGFFFPGYVVMFRLFSMRVGAWLRMSSSVYIPPARRGTCAGSDLPTGFCSSLRQSKFFWGNNLRLLLLGVQVVDAHTVRQFQIPGRLVNISVLTTCPIFFLSTETSPRENAHGNKAKSHSSCPFCCACVVYRHTDIYIFVQICHQLCTHS